MKSTTILVTFLGILTAVAALPLSNVHINVGTTSQALEGRFVDENDPIFARYVEPTSEISERDYADGVQVVKPRQYEQLADAQLEIRSPAPGIKGALKKALELASQSSKFSKIWRTTASGADGSSAYTDNNIRFDRDGPRRVLQINAQTQDPTLKKFIQAQRRGTHTQLAVLDITGQTGTAKEMKAFIKQALDEATK
ncbi:hypothetical protein BYT27DRAFT_7253521 [Phlegmacium glaucopus]|nr:hypothetical protein BYT27DRAFT_7253521 [Phlegmacium glaucopus]